MLRYKALDSGLSRFDCVERKGRGGEVETEGLVGASSEAFLHRWKRELREVEEVGVLTSTEASGGEMKGRVNNL